MRIRSGGIPPRCVKKSASVQSNGRTLEAADAGGEATLAIIVSPVEKCTPLIVERGATIVKIGSEMGLKGLTIRSRRR
jgi:hypothetical protein